MSTNNSPQKQIKPFVAGTPVSASNLNAMREAIVFSESGTQAGYPPYKPPFVAKITGASGAAFAWTEQGQTAATTWANLPGGRSGTTSVNPAYELNGNQSLMTNTLVWMHEEIDTTGALRYWFVLPNCLFPVKVQQTGGSNGSKTTAASYTYTARSLPWNGTSGGVTLGTGLSLARPRPNGKVTVQSGSTGYGVGFYDGLTFKLWDAGEVPGTIGCS